ncbi:cupin domain-containing protein [Herbidospora mongoliensis]|uniref:cupin domain-containing protein n=1 Tax=Herbidospora mongoliensis TaxID=688067 RepID=UPI0008315AA6|nr:cupin domain-containing protein [Herbidospora mongoliensis]
MFGIGVTALSVYDWIGADGRCGGSPHLHTLCAEAYVVVGGSGSVQTLTWEGFQETPLIPGAVVWFTPGTVHRLVNDGDLKIVVVMQNSGLPEAGDAVFTFPNAVLNGDYERAAGMAPRWRRDLALEGFRQLKEAGQPGFEKFLEHAVRLVGGRLDDFEHLWKEGPLKAVEDTEKQLASLRRGDYDYLREARIQEASGEPRDGMCGHQFTYPG